VRPKSRPPCVSCYLWWAPQPSWTTLTKTSPQAFLAIGFGGQFLLVDPPRDLVVVHRIDNGKFRFLRGNVGLGHFTALLGRILAAAPGD